VRFGEFGTEATTTPAVMAVGNIVLGGSQSGPLTEDAASS
jgi:hypothetical protein